MTDNNVVINGEELLAAIEECGVCPDCATPAGFVVHIEAGEWTVCRSHSIPCPATTRAAR